MITCDLLIKCTGQKPASDLMASLSPSAISSTGTVLVHKTLQVADSKIPNVFALGDVAETGGVRMGRAAAIQASVVGQNIVRAIQGQPLKEYHSISLFESGIDLTLGLTEGVSYFKVGEQEFLFPNKKKIALDSETAWRMNGAKPFDDGDYALKKSV
ncbi:hypothetical protein PVAG01_06155 [Phlyctema vagabunda]|uniref:FAD/NAD(P)-binding domain-containing protein n=1 Tax=Phlyctema vagabunda TaxID=108571 RepID=A0ABR4PF93_9HELO